MFRDVGRFGSLQYWDVESFFRLFNKPMRIFQEEDERTNLFAGLPLKEFAKEFTFLIY